MEELIDIEDGMLDCLTGISYQIPLSDEEVAKALNVLDRIVKKIDTVRRYIECLQCGCVDIIHYNAPEMDMIASIVLHIELQAEKRKKLKEDRRTDERWFDNLEEAYLQEPDEWNYNDAPDAELVPDLEVTEEWIDKCITFRNNVYSAPNKVLHIAEKKGNLEHIKYHITDGCLMELCIFERIPFHRYVDYTEGMNIVNDYKKERNLFMDSKKSYI